MAERYAREMDWYHTHSKPTKETEWAAGCGLSLEEFNELKEDIETAALAVKPEGMHLKGNKEKAKERTVKEFLKRVPKLGQAPDWWLKYAVIRMIGAAHSNVSRRKPTKGAKQANSTATPSSSQPTERQAPDTPLDSQVRSTPALHKTLLWIRVQVESLGYEELLPVSEVLTGPGGSASFESLKKSLRSNGALPVSGKETLLALWDNRRIAVRSDAVLEKMLDQVAASGEEYLDLAIPKPPSSNTYLPIRDMMVTGRAGDGYPESSQAIREPLTFSIRQSTPVGREHRGDRSVSPEARRPKRGRSRASSGNENNTDTSSRKRSRTSVRTSSDEGAEGEAMANRWNEDVEERVMADSSSETAKDESMGTRSDVDMGRASDGEVNNEESDDSKEDVEHVDGEHEHESVDEEPDYGYEDVDEETTGDGIDEGLDDEYDEDGDADEDSTRDATDEKTQARNVQNFMAEFRQGMRVPNDLLARVTPALMELMHAYFPLVDVQLFTRCEGIELPNWGLRSGFKFSPYQLAFIVWAFDREMRGIPGGLLADEAGTGKTLELTGLHIMGYLHAENVIEVEEARARRDPSHLPEAQQPGDKCPSRDKQPLACCCEARNEKDLYPAAPRRGITVAITPNAGLRSFKDDAYKMLEGAEIMKRRFPPRIAIHADRYNRDVLTGELGKEELQSTCMRGDWTEQEEYEKEHRTFLVNKEMRKSNWTEPKFKGPIASAPDAESNKAPRRACRVMVVTTRGSKEGQLDNKYRCTRTTSWKWANMRTPKLNSKTQSLMQVARIIWDECQQDSRGKVIPGFIRTSVDDYRKAHGRNPAVWGASGTPDSGNPVEPLLFLTNALRAPDWGLVDVEADQETIDQSVVLQQLTMEDVQEKKKDFDRLCEMAKVSPVKAARDDKYGQLIEFIRKALPIFLIRRGASTLWYNSEPIVPKASQLRLNTTTCEPDEDERAYVVHMEGKVAAERQRKYEELREAWQEAGGDPTSEPKKPSETKSDFYHTARAAATIAQIVKHWEHKKQLLGAGNRFSCSKSDDLAARWIKDPYGEELTTAISTSGFLNNSKLKTAIRICNDVRAAKRQDGTRCKVLITLRHPLSLAVWKNVLRHQYGKESIVLIEAGMSNRNRDLAKDTFDQQEAAWILLCTHRSVEVGLNVQRANYAIMVDLSHKYSDLVQLFGRIDRRGQTEPECHGFVLVNEASGIERRMVDSTSFTKAVQELVFQPKDGSDESGANP